MRRSMLAGAMAMLVAGAVSACGTTNTSAGGAPSASTTSCTYHGVQSELYSKGVLTVATDTPAYPPWFENNTPSNGKGYESAVAYAIAHELGFKNSQVHWVTESFTKAYGPGPKAFDFDINEVSYTPERATAVTFSNSYYDVQQSIVALKGTAIVTKHSPAQLKTYRYGDQIGTTGLAYINQQIQPTGQPQVYDTLDLAAAALEAHRIDALVTDTPTAQYMTTQQIKHAVLVGQFPTVGEHYGVVFAKGNPLVGCVNQAIAKLRANGTIDNLTKQWLSIYTSFPSLQP